jgi:DNA invertase Pin-like site-specific DNA recombinase
MGERPPGKTLDRYPDGNGNYEKSNCRWATAKEQGRNRWNVKLSEEKAAEILRMQGLFPKSEIARRYGVSRQTISRIFEGKIWA